MCDSGVFEITFRPKDDASVLEIYRLQDALKGKNILPLLPIDYAANDETCLAVIYQNRERIACNTKLEEIRSNLDNLIITPRQYFKGIKSIRGVIPANIPRDKILCVNIGSQKGPIIPDDIEKKMYSMRTPEEMYEVCNLLQIYLSSEHKTAGFDETFIKSSIDWLTFWASHGFHISYSIYQ